MSSVPTHRCEMSLSSQQQHYLQLMGIDVWLEKGIEAVVSQDSVSLDNTVMKTTPSDQVQDPVWRTLRNQVARCTQCALHQGRTQTVFGVGDVNADWMIIGEAPGKEEDRQGEPFVGRAGQLLNAMLEALGLQRQQVFIANILKCRPPDNRDPRPEEVAACGTYLQQQIDLIKPKIILDLGTVAAPNLIQVDTPIGRMPGPPYESPAPRVPIVVTYHPAYLLRSPREKAKSWQDLQLAMRIYKEVTNDALRSASNER